MPEDTKKREEYAPITQALRERLKVAALMLGHGLSTPLAKGVLAECDNIDALHKSLEEQNEKLRKELKERSTIIDADTLDFVHRLSDAVEKREDVTLFGVDYKALPPDADGVATHEGDEMVWCSTPGEWPTRLVVAITNEGFITYDGALGGYVICQAADYRHHHKPTVENVLREFVTEFNRDDSELCDDEIIERFAKRLQLADGDDDE